jgi:putative ABC transport system permease protein
MRLADILGLALSALWQQKVRTLLTTAGVIFGSFVLAASLSVDQGVQDTIERESRRSTELRKVDVQPQYEERESDIPAEEVQVKGRFRNARRERLRKALVKRRLTFGRRGPRVPLTRERLRLLGTIEHVETVLPEISLSGWANLVRQSHQTDVASVEPGNEAIQKRIVTGRFFNATDERSALVSELLLYELGMTDDAAIDAAVGKSLRLEFQAVRYGAGLGLYLTKPGRDNITRVENSALEKIKKQLPGRLDRFDITSAEKDALRRALREAPPRVAEAYSTELTITGILRVSADEDQRTSWQLTHADVVLPMGTAEDLFFRAPAQGERGVDRVTLLVDREENVKQVLEQVRKRELNAYAATEFIDRQRLMYLMLFGAMSCVAGVALLVAALGIANTMLMSVLERTREVGIMKAVGAGNAHVQLIFLVEGALIGLAGGGLGLLLAWVASIPGDRWVRSLVQRDMKIELKEALFVFPPWLILAVMGFALLITTLAAVYPARRAAKVNPVTALRHE